LRPHEPQGLPSKLNFHYEFTIEKESYIFTFASQEFLAAKLLQ
jgi:hypothetical protein